MARRLTCTALGGIKMVEPGDDLSEIVAQALEADDIALQDGDILVLAQKIVSKAEGRYAYLDETVPSARALELAARTGKDPRRIEIVLSESSDVVRAAPNLLIVVHRLGFVMANGGVDESNIDQTPGRERALLLPIDPDASCAALKARLDARFGVSIGLIINDSFGRPWRNGVTGVAIGAAGVVCLKNLIGAPDLYGRAMRVTEIAAADELAAAASLLMGQTDAGLPVVHMRGYSAEGAAQPARALGRATAQDLFR